MSIINLTQFLESSKTIQKVINLSGELSVVGFSIDTRTISPGELFVAIRGERYDGHDFADTAIRSGAAGVVIDEKSNISPDKNENLVIVVNNTVDFLHELAGWYRSKFRIPVIGVTGSTGKTTVKELMAAVLQQTFRVFKTEGNKNNFIGVPLTLLKLNHDIEIAVVELGTNQPGEIKQLAEIVRPTHSTITNIGSGHIGFFGSKEAIYNEKKMLFDRTAENGTIFLNIEDEFLKNYDRNRVLIKSFGKSSEADYYVRYIGYDYKGRVTFKVNEGPDIKLKIPGKHHMINALLAAAVGLEMGVSQDQVKEGLESVESPDKRMQVSLENGIVIINDTYNSNPESLTAAIDFLNEIPVKNNGKKFLVIGDMLELGEFSETEHRRIGEYLLSKSLDFVFCMGDESKFIYNVLRNSRKYSIRVNWSNNHEEIALNLRNRIRSGDTILLKGSRGMKMESIIEYLGIRR